MKLKAVRMFGENKNYLVIIFTNLYKDGFRMNDIHYKWEHGLINSIAVTPDILLPQFKHIGSKLKERKIELSTGSLK